MRYTYSVVRFVPDPVRGEFVNVGVIVGSDESSEWQLRTIENTKRARGIDAKGLLPVVWTFVDYIGRQLDAYTEAVDAAQERTPAISEDWLRRLSIESRNVVQLSQPTPIIADDVNDAFVILFEQFILEPETRRYSFQKKHSALAAVRRAYSASGLLRGLDFDEAAVVKGAFHSERFDFTVLNGRVVQLVQAWSFQVPAQEELLEKIKAWAWTVADIRRHGGEAQVSDRAIAVPETVDVSAVYVPPVVGAQSKALDEALSAFREIRVEPLSLSDVSNVALRARALLGK